MKRKVTPETAVWKVVLFLFGIICTVSVVVPILYLVALSLASGRELADGGMFLWPKKLDFTAYEVVLSGGSALWKGYAVSLFRVVAGTTLSTLVTFMLGYGIACRTLPGRKFFIVFILITAFFSGGLIPNYMVIRNLGLLNNILVYILPNLVSAWCVILMMQYIQNVPQTVLDAAVLDGAGPFRLMFQFVLPLALPSVIAISLFYAIAQWNTWFDAYIYVRNSSLQPVQTILRSILASGTRINQMVQLENIEASSRPLSRSVQAAAVIVCSLPILVIYPAFHWCFKQSCKQRR